MPEMMLDAALKSQQWEIAKGHLRALVAMQGSYPALRGGDSHESTWRELGEKVESFIKEIEDEALYE